MIERWNRPRTCDYVHGEPTDCGAVHGFACGQMGMRDVKIYCNEVSGTIDASLSLAAAFEMADDLCHRGFIDKMDVRRFIESKVGPLPDLEIRWLVKETGPIGPECFGGSDYD